MPPSLAVSLSVSTSPKSEHVTLLALLCYFGSRPVLVPGMISETVGSSRTLQPSIYLRAASHFSPQSYCAGRLALQSQEGQPHWQGPGHIADPSLCCPSIMSDETFSDLSTYMTISTGENPGEP